MRVCGTYSAYCAGCRCDACREANTERSRTLREDPDFRAADASRARVYRAENPSKLRDAEFRRKYGLTLAGRDLLLEQQGDACAVCRTPDFGSRGPQVDHDHVDEEVRGILCVGCNIGIGALDDDPPRMVAAAAYVERHRSPLASAGMSAGLLF